MPKVVVVGLMDNICISSSIAGSVTLCNMFDFSDRERLHKVTVVAGEVDRSDEES